MSSTTSVGSVTFVLLTKHHNMCESEGISPSILNLAPDEGQWWALHCSHFCPSGNRPRYTMDRRMYFINITEVHFKPTVNIIQLQKYLFSSKMTIM